MKELELNITPESVGDEEFLISQICNKIGVRRSELLEYKITKRSLDARGKPIYRLKIAYCLVNDDKSIITSLALPKPELSDVEKKEKVIVVGSGPAGLFAAYRLIELGLCPIVIERGKKVRERRLDLAQLMRNGKLDPNSNYCFGEGGAGTFSDGKLYTRSTKRGPINEILSLLVHHGASESILIDAHPHIGTNKLPKIITNIREHLESRGAIFYFSTSVESLLISNQVVKGVNTNNGPIEANAVILATGHSARDVFYFLDKQGILIEAKSFALGIRIEHPQELINKTQYGKYCEMAALPPASYTLSTQESNRGVYSFCMCPGGIICPAATEVDGVVVNGWSPSTRSSKYANSGIVVEVPLLNDDKFYSINFQKTVEQVAFQVGGGKFRAPAQRVSDFIKTKSSSTLPPSSYQPGLTACSLDEVLPLEISKRLRNAVKEFSKSKPLLNSSEGVMVAVESRTSSPIRIPRKENGMHPEVKGLFPCGEGAGFAGGIVSAALDGRNMADCVKIYLS